jgi:hypothetical protein
MSCFETHRDRLSSRLRVWDGLMNTPQCGAIGLLPVCELPANL